MAYAARFFSVLVALSLFTAVVSADIKREEFAKYEKTPVVLKDVLYSIDYAAPLALSNRTQRKVLGVTVVSSDKGVYYGGKFINLGEFNDRDPEQLASKVTSSGGRVGFLAQLGSGERKPAENGIREAKLLKFPAGSKMEVKKVDIKDNRLVIELYDEFTKKGDASTALNVELAAGTTLEQADALIAKFLEIKR